MSKMQELIGDKFLNCNESSGSLSEFPGSNVETKRLRTE